MNEGKTEQEGDRVADVTDTRGTSDIKDSGRETLHGMKPPQSLSGHYARQLTAEEVERLQRQDTRPIAPFKKEKLEKESMKNWDKFYLRNETRFFKDRHWTKEEFKQLCHDIDWTKPMTLFEAGCGVGNFLLPFIDSFPNIVHAYGCDFSKRAVDLLKQRDSYDPSRCTVFTCDLTQEDSLLDHIAPDSIDLCTLIFVLSAISESKMVSVVRNINRVLKSNGSVVVRDYGLYDYAMLRFEPGQKLDEKAYVRQDGTKSYYFSEEDLRNLFVDNGFQVVTCEYICKDTVNRKEDICVPRVFIQGRFVKR